MSDNEDILNSVRRRNTEQATAAGANRNEAKVRLLMFRLGDEWFGLEAQQVREISRIGALTRVPLTPSHVMGVVNLRGSITAVIDIRGTLGLPQAVLDSSARIIVAKHEGLEAGIIAEAVVEMVEAPRSTLQPPLITVGSERARYASYILEQKDKKIVIVLNLASLLESLKVR